MKPLHAVNYDDCLFCRMVAGDIPATIVAEDQHTLAFLDIAPANPGHTLVIPKRHATDLHAISPEDFAACACTAQRVAAQIVERLNAEGVNILNSCGAAAWQTVFHFHLHVIPRYEGDDLQLPWKSTPVERSELEQVRLTLQKLDQVRS